MKVLVHHLDGAASELIDAPIPSASPARSLIETRATVVSAGTERMIIGFGQGNLVQKARQQPDKVRQVLNKARTEGIATTFEAVRAKLGEPLVLGYCQAGVVVDKGVGGRLPTGTRVVANGPHAEYTSVPHNLISRIPDGVSFDAAAFTPLAAIGLQGIRLAGVTMGETVVVYGLGLIGLLTVQLLRANGCRVIGIDTNESRLALGSQFGAIAVSASAPDVASRVFGLTGGVGADAVLLTLATDSDEPAHNAAEMSRKRGRIVLVGVTGLQLRREDFYAKELSFAVSCSYGPGRYDPEYEDKGHDYPLPFVRWTEQRNFDAVLQLMADGALNPHPLISHRFSFDDAPQAYEILTSGASSLGIVLEYPDRGGKKPPAAAPVRITARAQAATSTLSVGVIGAGNFGSRVLIPALKAAGGHLHTILSSRGTSAAIAGRKHAFEYAGEDLDALLANADIDTIVILTRHDTHAKLALRALAAGKHVFVEKPLALSRADLDALEKAVTGGRSLLSVGFNRRFAPLAVQLRQQLERRVAPAALIFTVNAGAIPRDHWVQQATEGGGRIAGEGCHFIDLARYLVGSPLASLNVVTATNAVGGAIDDIASLSLSFEDGSTAAIHYLANGSSAFPKERIEAFADGKVWQIDNWRKLRSWGGKGVGSMFSRPDKGHAAEMRAFAAAVRGGGPPPIPYAEMFEVSRWTILAAEAARDYQRS
jgi:predicted dehydrogenase/threonine dehydrogenase-like Zn-dependent dehydrogenase